MKLNRIPNEPMMDLMFGIDSLRIKELKKFVHDYFKSNVAIPAPTIVGMHYEAFANKCNTLEEYTLCMHYFIFLLARTGSLMDEREIIN